MGDEYAFPMGQARKCFLLTTGPSFLVNVVIFDSPVSTNLRRKLMERLLGLLRMGRLAHWPHAAVDSLGGWHSARPLLLMALIATAPMAFSQMPLIIPTIEAPGIQTSPLVGNTQATGVAVETFEE